MAKCATFVRLLKIQALHTPLTIAILLAATPAATQTTVRITGIITDRTDSVLPGATVKATELASNRIWMSVSDATGTYNLVALPAGSYRVTVEHSGFRPMSSSLLTLDVAQVRRFDVKLEVGAVDQVVEVRGSSLQAASTEVNFAITTTEVSKLPLNGRNFLALALMAPGAVATNPLSFFNGQRTTSGGRPYVNGNRKETNNVQLDGVDNNQTTDNLVSYLPSPDAVHSITLITNNAPAEFGNYQGAIINVTLKSGSNELHGSLFEYFRDEALNATNWAANHRPVDPLNPHRKGPRQYNVFGGTMAGPLVRNRIFFFGDYQGTRRRFGATTGLITVITGDMRRGDFSALLQGSNPQQLYDPLTTGPDPANPGQSVRVPFRDNQIPAERLDRVAAALFTSRFYPEPSVARVTNNAFSTTRNTLDNDQFDVKMDGAVDKRNSFSARYAHGLQRTSDTNSPGIFMASATRSPFRAGMLHWIRHVRPSVINETRLGFNRIVLRLDGGLDAAGIGNLGEAIAIKGANRRGPGLPAISFSGAAQSIGSPKAVQSFTTNTFQYQDTLLLHAGPHAVKMGILALRYQQNVYFSGNSGQLGLIEFNGQYTRDLRDPRSIGSPIADFLLGFPSRLARGDFAGTWGHRSTLWAGFLQDDWRPTRDLTFNVGLRYEYRTPFVEVHNRQVNFDLATGRALFAGKDGNSRALYHGYPWDFQPRLGIAWTPNDLRHRMVVRGGYGISSFLEGTGTNLRLTLNPPFFNEFERLNADAAVLPLPIGEGFDALREKDPLTGTVLRAWDPKHRPARSHQWNLTAEYQMAGDVTASVGYVGQYGTHLVVPVNFNQRLSPNGPQPFDNTYPQISGVILTTPNANQRYDGLQATGRKRFAAGWEFVGAYTLSKATSHGRGFFTDGGQGAEQAAYWPNPRNRDSEWGPVPFDVRHNVTAAAVVELPWGTGRRWLKNLPGWINALTDDWSLSVIWKAHTGFPITLTAPDQSQTSARTGRPDRLGTGRDPHEVGPGRKWFDTSVFLLPNIGAFGNAPVGAVRGPGLNVLDTAVSKRIALPRGATLDLRVEAFNVLNTPVFNAPDRSLTSATFGQVLSSQLEREIQLAVRVDF